MGEVKHSCGTAIRKISFHTFSYDYCDTCKMEVDTSVGNWQRGEDGSDHWIVGENTIGESSRPELDVWYDFRAY